MDGFEELPFESIPCAKDILGLAIAASGEYFVLGHYYSADDSERVNLSKWGVVSRKQEEVLLKGDPSRYPSNIHIAGAEEAVFFLTEQGAVKRLDWQSGQCDTLPFKKVKDLSVAGNGWMAIVGERPWLIDGMTGKEIGLEKILAGVEAVAGVHICINKKGNRLFVAGIVPQEIVVYDLPGMTAISRLPGAPEKIKGALADGADRYYFCKSTVHSGEAVWDLASRMKRMQQLFRPDSGPANPSLDFHPSLPVVAKGSHNGLLILIDLEREKILTMQSICPYPVRGVKFLPDGQQLLVATGDGFVHFMDLSAPGLLPR